MKVLCTADVHIGRRPSRLPSHVDCRPLSCGEAWGRVVDVAIGEGVDVVAVSGDLVDRENRFYEAAGPVELGIRRLAEAEIMTVMVAGNHDHEVLPRVLEGVNPKHVRLLGARGEWERFTVERGGEQVYFDGWSFPRAIVRGSPVVTYPFTADGTPVIGMLHADLDQPSSSYAPVSLAELRPRAPALWLLGHIHAPWLSEEAGSASVLYPGSPQAMDPGEEGMKGVWIVETGAGRELTCRMVPISTVRYETMVVDVDGVAEGSEVDGRVVEAVKAALERAVEEGPSLRYLSCRVRLAGRTPLHRQLEDRLSSLPEDFSTTRGEATAFVERVTVTTAPARDLAALAGGKDAAAVLARLIRDLEEARPDGAPDPLLREVARRVEGVMRAKPYMPLASHGDDERRAEEELDLAGEVRSQAMLLLDELLAQKEVGG